MRGDLPGVRLRERGGLTRWLWVLWAFMSLGIAALSAGLVITHAQVRPIQQVPAILQNRMKETIVSVPAGIPLKEVLVEVGDQVSIGETLALYDVALIEVHIADLNRAVLVDNVMRTCLENGEMPDPEAVASATDSETQLQLDRVGHSCTALHFRHATARKRVLQARRNLDYAQDELEGRLGQTILQTQSPTIKASTARQISVARNLHALRSEQLEIERVALHADQQQEIADLLLELETSVSKSRARLRVLQTVQAAPRLLSPESGLVSDMRHMELGHAYLQDVSMAKVTSETGDEFVVQFAVPYAVSDIWSIGTEVSVGVAGLGPEFAKLHGRISSKNDTVDLSNGSPVVRFDVMLDDSISDVLKQERGLKPLTGETHTEVIVSQKARPFWKVLQETTLRLFRPAVA